MTYNDENAILQGLYANINTPASHMLKHKFGTTLKTQVNIDVYNAFYRVCPVNHPETQFIPREAAYCVATMFYKYRNRYDVQTHMRFEEALHRGYAACKSETSRRSFERLLSQTPGTATFNRQLAHVCSLMEQTCSLANIDYAALLYDISHWHRDKGIARRWSRVMHQYTPTSETIEQSLSEINE